ncbi:MAG: hypothetical protein WA968_02545 [Castellaniella sp.]|uniref:c-type cytochrome n=1 Tax=Castellaniella sp. TaxID=1955812 RepID=UPI003A9550EB
MIGAIFDKVYPDGDPTTHIRAILHSVSGVAIDGVTYPSPMPAFGGVLSDADVADIVNHERTSWSNQAKQVTDKQVAMLHLHMAGGAEGGGLVHHNSCGSGIAYRQTRVMTAEK